MIDFGNHYIDLQQQKEHLEKLYQQRERAKLAEQANRPWRLRLARTLHALAEKLEPTLLKEQLS